MRSVVLTLAAIVAAPVASEPALKAGVFDPPREAPQFSLQSSGGAGLPYCFAIN